ncbi:MAG: hypothetical protein Q4G50_05220 [Corynebacterium sp.]|uniref:hypothetical protein n=1 Tax=Corynebacterium sp. TaxID=1720 RepID=UPI0026DFFA28|nr:hypothetical protein [Corynebacterium sp.]MDO5669383.1 hypothetical protein [Corynebacterium sp.]
MTTGFIPQTTADLRARRQELLSSLAPRTVQDLLDLRAIDHITLDEERVLDEILGLDYVIGNSNR